MKINGRTMVKYLKNPPPRSFFLKNSRFFLKICDIGSSFQKRVDNIRSQVFRKVASGLSLPGSEFYCFGGPNVIRFLCSDFYDGLCDETKRGSTFVAEVAVAVVVLER